MTRRQLLLTIALLCAAGGVVAATPYIIVQSTTSTQNSGLFDAILPQFTAATGIEVRVVAVGTGQALKNAANGDGDVVLVHSRADEDRFVADGFGVERFDLMYNDFVFVGPPADPAGIAGLRDAVTALARIGESKSPFASRADDSGTHKIERRLWRETDIDPVAASGSWYRETGSGMGATLNTAIGMDAYTVTDRASWISFANKRGFRILVEGDPRLFNQYGVILVNPERHPQVKAMEGQRFIDWLLGPTGQTAIAGFRIDGQQLYYPNAAVADWRAVNPREPDGRARARPAPR